MENTKTPIDAQTITDFAVSEMDSAQANHEPLLVSASAAARLLGISRAQFWKLHSAGKVPMPIYLGTRAPRWRLDELRAFVTAGCPDRQTWEKLKQRRKQ